MFNDFKVAVQKQFDLMKQHELFRAEVSKDLLWETYLSNFPEGTNPIYKERTEHDCTCCRSFIRAVGDVVAIIDGKVVSIWDAQPGGFYQVVADALSNLVKSSEISNIFLHPESVAGVDKNFQQADSGEMLTWEHFYIKVPTDRVVKGLDIGSRLSESRSTKDVFLRSLKEISMDSIDTVLELIAQNSLYRGEEHKFAVESFLKLKKEFSKLPSSQHDIFCWSKLKSVPQSVSKIRGTVIGTLLVDLSEGKDLEPSVGSFEAKVAPSNYKRPTALITKGMIEKAQRTIEELGLTSALQRRYAVTEDITVNNILFANRESKQRMNVFEELASAVPENMKSFDRVEEIGITEFISNVLPKVESLEILLENKHAGNMVSLIAPIEADAKGMFKWPNNFSWSYTGDVADSIKERVKKAGGKVDGALCCRLAWNNTDDLDFHMVEPNGQRIYYSNRRKLSPNGGRLDLDANGADGMRTDPAENIYYADKRRMREGGYTLQVNQYQSRNSSDVGFEVEIEFGGTTHNFVYPKAMRSGEYVEVAQIKYSHKDGFEIIKSLPSSQTSKVVWGLPTQTFHKVNVLMHSPNHWDGHGVGNKHFFFMLDQCVNEGKARGFYNEFLNEELNAHRKVFEVVGSKMKVEESENQLSGIGFSSTQRSSVLCRVKGSFTRTLKINF